MFARAMNFLSKRSTVRFLSRVCTVATLAFSSCHTATSKKQKALRAEFAQAMREHSYGRAAELARHLLTLNKQDNGSWDRLIQAQFGLRDYDGIKRTLEEWRRTASKSSSKLDEYTGDLALTQSDPVAAVEAWTKALTGEPKALHIFEKIAQAERNQKHWAEEDAAWTAYINVQDAGMARLRRALCRRHLHRWEDAFDDLKHAKKLAPNDPEVSRTEKLFAQMGDHLDQIREINAALAVSPNDPGLLADRALLSLKGQDYEMALEDSIEAARLGPWALRPRLFQGIALIELGRLDEGTALGIQKSTRLATLTPEFLETISRLDSEISVERSNADLYVARAWQLNEINQPILALQDAEKGARLDSKSAGACAESSYALMKLGRVEEALEQIKRATELDANLATAWQYRGELEMERGETMAAVDSLSRALDMNQTVTALQKREQCYRRLGLLVKAEQDRRTLEELNAGAPK